MGMFGLKDRLQGTPPGFPPSSEVACFASPLTVPGDASSEFSGDGGTGGSEVPSMHHRRFGVVAGEAIDTDVALRKAVERVVSGFDDALQSPGLSACDAAWLRRCRALALNAVQDPVQAPLRVLP